MVFRRFPGRNIINIKNEIDKVYDEIFANQPDDEESMGNIVPTVNIEENDQAFVVSAELPGMDSNDIKITFQDGTLCISGEKKREKEDKGKNYHRHERDYGSFSRRFSIPSRIKSNKIDASFDKGVLTVQLPKAEDVKPQEIKINIK